VTAPRETFRRFIGIDLGGGRGKNTAVARLELTAGADGSLRLAVSEAKVRYGQRGTGQRGDEPGGDALFRDDVLVRYLERWVDEHTVVAIDAPLTLPPCIRCTLPCPGVEHCSVPVVEWMRRWAPQLSSRSRSDRAKPVVTPYTQRATEVLWSAVGVKPRETLGQGTGPLTARAAYLRRILSPALRLHENLLEVHPRATIQRLAGSGAERQARHGETTRVWEARKRLLAELSDGIAFDYVWPELVVRSTHVFYAVVCAYTAFLWSRRRWRGPHELRRDDADPDPEGDPVHRAARDLADLWLEDGWIFAPPAA
jgi:predicted nuclease with RNAse H fold